VDDRAARELVGRIEAQLEVADEAASELVASLLELYGEGLARLLARAPDPAGAARDEVVGHLLLLHGLHPVPLAERVRGALAEVRPYLESHGGDVELVGVEDGVVQLRLQGSCSGCPSSTATLKLAIEEAIQKAAPDVERIEAEGAAAPSEPALLQIEVAPRRSWTEAVAPPDLASGGTAVLDVGGDELLFVQLDGRLYAYRPRCPACGGSLAGGVVIGTVLGCPTCGGGYDVRRAGRGDEDANLEPVPLLTGSDGRVKLALGAPAAA
jgi:Fe-S cluster biogenesis protein NfuA/nitrite reductase/ring-hydroxylating ferredoxin subunit